LDLAVAVSWSRGPRFASPVDATVPFEVTPPFVSMPRNPVQFVGAQGTSAIAAVPRDRANERSNVLEKIVVGQLNILPARHISQDVKYIGLRYAEKPDVRGFCLDNNHL
jgi:hypothetical protein